ncbi:hypothetical protein BGZ94_008197 [Podila epigama]|nr:hypothetical protein BGZ94_008197 [Podila epigama]
MDVSSAPEPPAGAFDIVEDSTQLGIWTTNEIVYMSIAGVLLLMALAEIFAFTWSLTYSFIKVHQKARAAGRRGVQYTSLLMLVIFWGTRIIFLAAMLSLVPIPHWQGMSAEDSKFQFLPEEVIIISQYFAFSLVGLLLVLPMLISIHQLWTSPTNVKEQLDEMRTTSTFPRVLIVMPVYNELPEVLHLAICSAIDGDYPKEHLHIFISFDNDAISDLYRALISSLGVPSDGDYYPPVLDLYYRGVQITVSRFPHGGKRLTQKKTFGVINSIYRNYPEKTDHLFVLFIDSDIILPPATVANFMWDMQLKPGSTKDLLGMTGVITVTTKDDMTFLNLLQDIEYVHGQFFGRAIESAAGACVTLPGALTIFRYSAFLKSYNEYFADAPVSDLWDFGRSHLGEDRYLTHLLMTKAPRSGMIQFCHRATCKTEPVREWRNLLKQRRRWFLGFLTNEGAFLSDPALWCKYPWLLTFRMIQDVVNGTSMVSYAVVVAIATGVQHWSWIWLGLLIAYFCVNWGLMFVYGLWIGRKKAFLYPLMFIVGPFITWYLLVYGVLTANERTWGGPRADASKDEEHGKTETPDDAAGHGHDGDNGEAGQEKLVEDEEEWLELPDHLFYPRLNSNSRRQYVGGGSDEDSDVNSMDISRDVKPDQHSPHNTKNAASRLGSVKAPRLLELNLTNCQTPDTWDESHDTESRGVYQSDIGEDINNDDDSDDNDDSDEGYFNFKPLGFAAPDIKKDTEWWDSDHHLSRLGILPFVDQPKIPAMFASTETLVLSPVIPAARSLKKKKSQAGSTWSMSIAEHFDDRRMSSVSSLAIAGPSTAPGTPRTAPLRRSKSLHASSVKAAAMEAAGASPSLPQRAVTRPPSPVTAGSRRGSMSLPLPPGFVPSPAPSFRYVPVAYITPTNSTPSTPKLSPSIAFGAGSPPPMPSPMNLPSTSSASESPQSASNVVTPAPRTSTSSTGPYISTTGQAVRVKITGNVPSSIIAAAVDIPNPNMASSSSSGAASTSRTQQHQQQSANDNVKRITSRVKAVQNESLSPPTPPLSSYASSASSSCSTAPPSPTPAARQRSRSQSRSRSRSRSRSTARPSTMGVGGGESVLVATGPAATQTASVHTVVNVEAEASSSSSTPPVPRMPKAVRSSSNNPPQRTRSLQKSTTSSVTATTGGSSGAGMPTTVKVGDTPVAPPRRSSLHRKRRSSTGEAEAAAGEGSSRPSKS